MDNVNVIRTGFIAPDLSLPSTDGGIISLKEILSDDFLALCFFSDSSDKRIRSLLTELNTDLPKSMSGFGYKVVAVSPEKIHRLGRLKNDLSLKYPLLSDERMNVCRRYYVVNNERPGRQVYFSIFIVDNELIVRHRVSEAFDFKFHVEDFKKDIAAII